VNPCPFNSALEIVLFAKCFYLVSVNPCPFNSALEIVLFAMPNKRIQWFVLWQLFDGVFKWHAIIGWAVYRQCCAYEDWTNTVLVTLLLIH